MPRVSIVVPSYNNERDIVQTIESILNQTYRDFELIVSDHTSSDGTVELLEPYREKGLLRLESLPTGGGAPANWNSVSNFASGEFLKLVCGDDLLERGIVERQIRALDSHPGAVLAASPRAVIDASGKTLIRKRGLGNLKGLVNGPRAVHEALLSASNLFGEPAFVLMRRDSWSKAGGWTGEFPYLIDQHTYSNVLLRGDFVAVPEVGGSFRVSTTQWSSRLIREQAAQVIAFHRAFVTRNEYLLSKPELYLANAKARMNALGRRGVYTGLKIRASLQKSR